MKVSTVTIEALGSWIFPDIAVLHGKGDLKIIIIKTRVDCSALG